jgi:hypothetical protein
MSSVSQNARDAPEILIGRSMKHLDERVESLLAHHRLANECHQGLPSQRPLKPFHPEWEESDQHDGEREQRFSATVDHCDSCVHNALRCE